MLKKYLVIASICAASVALATTRPDFPTCADVQYQNGHFVFGDHASHHGPNDWHGIIGDILPDGTVIPLLVPDPDNHQHNVLGVDDTYCVGTDPQNPCDEVLQCFCGLDTRTIIVNGNPQTLYGWGIQTQWSVINSCSDAVGDEICALHSHDWNVPFWEPYPNNSLPASALHSNLYPCFPLCGDGVTQSGEQCDDGKHCSNGTLCVADANCVGIGDGLCTMRGGDGCSASCGFEQICGNGVVEGNEECDDGNQINTDACDNSCNKQEVCHDNNDNDDDGLVDCVDAADCDCDLFERDPARIVFNVRNPAKDHFKASGGIIPGEPFAPETKTVCFLLANATQGKIWSACLQPGDLVHGAGTAKRWKFKDPTAKSGPGIRGGLYEVSIGAHGGPTQYIVRVRAYEEFSGITDLYLTVQVSIDDQEWASTGLWRAGGNSIQVNFVH
ncbi:MAG: DUF4215 domain-containing protein [Patescibacteria group bacterium]|mgnify:CR=1 FL=1